MKNLGRVSFSNRTGNNLGGRTCAIHTNLNIRLRFLLTVCHQTLQNKQLGICVHLHIGGTDRGIYPFDLHSIQSEYRIFPKFNIGYRIQDPASGSISFAVMLLFIMNIGIFSNMEGVNAIVTAFIASAVVDSAACNNIHVCTVFHIKIIVNQVCHAGYAHYNRDENLLSLCLSINKNIDSRLVFFFPDFDVLTVAMTDGNAILAQIVCTFLLKTFADLIQYALGGFFYFNHQHLPPSVMHF